MTDGEALRRAVLEDPDDDAPRLVYADWCDERGEAERAEFVRLQIWQAGDLPDHGHQAGCDCPSCRAYRRVRDLAREWADGWAGPLRRHFRRYTWHRGFLRGAEMSPDAFLALAADVFRAHPLTEVRLAGKWPAASPAGKFYWHRAGRLRDPARYDVPAELMPDLAADPGAVMCVYDTPAAARAALSRACVAFGRRVAGLPPLPSPA